MKQLATAPNAEPVAVQHQGGPGAAGLRDGQGGLPGQLPVHLRPAPDGRQGASCRRSAGRAGPRVDAEPAEPAAARRDQPRASARYTKHPARAFEAALCLAQPENQVIALAKGGLPPTQARSTSDPRISRRSRSPTPQGEHPRRRAAPGRRPPTATSRWRSRTTLHPPAASTRRRCRRTLKSKLDDGDQRGASSDGRGRRRPRRPDRDRADEAPDDRSREGRAPPGVWLLRARR